VITLVHFRLTPVHNTSTHRTAIMDAKAVSAAQMLAVSACHALAEAASLLRDAIYYDDLTNDAMRLEAEVALLARRIRLVARQTASLNRTTPTGAP
jgi:hypothetical protein